MNIYITILNEYYELLKISSKTNEGIFFFTHTSSQSFRTNWGTMLFLKKYDFKHVIWMNFRLTLS